jgi:hypothetical protein
LACLECTVEQFGLKNVQLSAYVEAMWGVVEQQQVLPPFEKAEATLDGLPEIVEEGLPVPEAWADLPAFVLKAIHHAHWVPYSEMFGGMDGRGDESADLAGRVLDLCRENGVKTPDPAAFASKLPFNLAPPGPPGWGQVHPRSYYVGTERGS